MGIWLINGIQIPQRKRSGSAEPKQEENRVSSSLLEVAEAMIEMANGDNRERKKPRREEMESGQSSSEMPAAMREWIVRNGGYEIQLVIEKKLEESDVSRNHGRLCLPTMKLKGEFAREDERRILDEENGGKKKKMMMKKKNGLEVGIMDVDLRESSMSLKKWKIGSDRCYCLVKNWNSFVEENGLKSGDDVQIWSFRKICSDRLCFAIVKLSHQRHC
ncbi:B3 domain-containing protein [Cucumis melo var. makuwa]|uniref:B3 domain-containing protein At1g05920-like n=2 Tax=Cucumis melo TaxID=3656 RepID=A0A1S4DVE5_CUCME|nr:B3 domain-containing protein At1g05920-like [Cucumis melo]KAA0065186.1 B3 domain-containing protein [Cucumis melo var. makuwa]